MRIKSSITALCLCLGLSAWAQTIGVRIELPATEAESGMKVFMCPADKSVQNSAVELAYDGKNSSFSGEVGVNPAGIYNLYCQTQSYQTSIPVYVAPGTRNVDFSLRLNEYLPETSLSDEVNSSIASYNNLIAGNSRRIGNDLKAMTDDEIKTLLGSYMTKADAITSNPDIPADVREYVRIWSYVSAYDAIGMANYISRHIGRELDVKASDFIPAPEKVLDNTVAVAFPTSGLIVVSSIPKGEIEERMETLYGRYSTPEIRNRASSTLMTSWLDSFDYDNKFDEGEKRLEALTEKYSLPQDYLSTFRARRSTIVGAPFPDVELQDREGNKVDFSKFRGKYVYVDLWASWCGPCCREVPHLQKLEEELKDSNVTFVSISTDSGTPQWIKKMNQLNMHGNQLINLDGSLPKKLNVKGIPRFLIYDPEGKLYMADAPRPSNQQTLQLLKDLK